MIITLSGIPGAGKSTLATAIADHFSLERLYMGQVLRNCAHNRGMDTVTYMRYLKEHPKEEKEIDRQILDFAKKDNVLIESRTAFHFLPAAIKIFVKVAFDEGVRRIFADVQKSNERNEKRYTTFDEAYGRSQERHRSDVQRYRRLYDVDIMDESNYDIVFDTTVLTIEEAKKQIIAAIEDYLSKQQSL
jgi:predicted cytidylate kinase